jgi:hypothetical protein
MPPSGRYGDRDRNYPPEQQGGGFLSSLNSMTVSVIAGVLILGIVIGTLFSSSATFNPQSVASREAIDRSAPSAGICAQYGASAITMDLRAFVTLNPFSVYVSQPLMQPGCVLRSSNWSILERSDRVDSQDVRECKNRMNTFAFTGDIEEQGGNVQVDCVYQNDGARNLFLSQPGFRGVQPESERF